MTIGVVASGFPTGTNIDQIDVGLVAIGTNSAETATHFTISIGDESLVLGGSGFVYNGSGVPTGGTVTSIEDQYQGQVAYNLSGFSIAATQIEQWAAVDDTASLLNGLFGGADTLSGGPLADLLRSYAGNDSINGGAGDDTLDGGLGNDTLNGGAGHDLLITGGGVDTIVVGLGQSGTAPGAPDVISGWTASDTITFASGPAGGSDYVETTAADYASALTAANALIGAGTANVVVVGVGSDLVVFADSANNNGTADDAVTILGHGLGDISVSNFTLSAVSPPPPPVSPPPPPPPPATVGGNAPSGASGSTSTATAGNDSLVATATTTEIHAGAGNDTIIGASVADYLRGDDGDDSISGGAVFDDINGNAGNDTAHGNAGDDWVVGGKGDDVLFGDAGNDIVWGNLGNDTLSGGDGNDQVRGGQGDDSLAGGAGNDFISGDRGNDTESGGAGADIFHTFSGAGIDKVLDFNLAEGDRVQLDPGTVYSYGQVGADTVIDMGNGDQMILVGVQASTLTSGWIFGA
jgi:Ca2+-binding RTX toxin-like protein